MIFKREVTTLHAKKIFLRPSNTNTDKCVDYVCKYADKSEEKIMCENLTMILALGVVTRADTPLARKYEIR